jgi:hypothetical protein
VADLGLQVLRLLCRRNAGAEVVRGDGLPDRTNVVFLALDGHQGGALDRSRLDQLAAHPEAPQRQIAIVEHARDCLQVKS